MEAGKATGSYCNSPVRSKEDRTWYGGHGINSHPGEGGSGSRNHQKWLGGRRSRNQLSVFHATGGHDFCAPSEAVLKGNKPGLSATFPDHVACLSPRALRVGVGWRLASGMGGAAERGWEGRERSWSWVWLFSVLRSPSPEDFGGELLGWTPSEESCAILWQSPPLPGGPWSLPGLLMLG